MDLAREARIVVWQTLAESDSASLPDRRIFATQLIHEALGIDITKIPSIAAWVKIHAKHAFRDAGFPKVSENVLHNLIAASWEFDQADGGKKPAIVEKFSQTLSESRFILSLEQSESLLQAYLSKMKLEKSDKNPTKDSSSTLKAKTRKQKSQSGDQVDYKFYNKEKWREAWEGFISRRLAGRPLPGAVICLPGQNPEAEVSIYKRNNLGPIYGVEGGSLEVRRTFEANAVEHEILPVLGRLEDIVPRFKSEVAVASFDFLGQICPLYLDIMREVPLAERTLVLTNVRVGRESARIQRSFAYVADAAFKADQVKEGLAEIERLFRQGVDQTTLLEKRDVLLNGVSAQPSTQAQISKSRNDMLEFAMLYQCGINRSLERNPYSERLTALRTDGESLMDLRARVTDSARYFEKHLLDHLGRMRLPLPEKVLSKGNAAFIPQAALSSLVAHAVFQKQRVVNVEKYAYQSEVSGRSIYYSTFAELEIPRNLYHKWRHSTNFLFAVAEWQMTVNGEMTIEYTDKNGYAIKAASFGAAQPLPKGSQVIVSGMEPNGKKRFLASIEISRLLADLFDYDATRKERWKLDLPEEQAKLDRIWVGKH